jgi:protein-disulfide isomerase
MANLHGRLFAYQNQLGASQLPRHAKAIGLDMAKFEQCLKGTEDAAVRRDVEEGLKAGVQATPTFFLGMGDADGQGFKVLKMLVGVLPYGQFKEAIDSILNNSEN